MDERREKQTTGETTHKSPRDRIARGLKIWMLILLGQSVLIAGQNWRYFNGVSLVAYASWLLALVVGGMACCIIESDKQGRRWMKIWLWGGLLVFVMIVLLSMRYPSREHARRIICRSQLGDLARAMYVYAHDDGGYCPEGEHWGEALVSETDMSGRLLFCPSDDQPEGNGDVRVTSYALNAEAEGKVLNDLPGDMILFFEAELDEQDRVAWIANHAENVFEVQGEPWRAVSLYGGAELVSFRHYLHSRGVHCVRVDGEVLNAEDPLALRWYVDKERELDEATAALVAENLERPRGVLREMRNKAYLKIAGWLVGPYVVWGLVTLLLRMRQRQRRETQKG
ncbi:MAG: hypothetical protein JW936_05380 [Sedimentisphaerales bacterium]|nr:hypothetical protein [Sedimentisphaerales bacterium]